MRSNKCILGPEKARNLHLLLFRATISSNKPVYVSNVLEKNL